MATFLDLKEISRSFPGVKALDRVSFGLQPGIVHALVGENGAGKSTLIKIISGALAADSGEMLLNGVPYQPHNPQEAFQAGISTIYQELNLLSYRSVLANITLGKESHRFGILDSKTARQRVMRVLEPLKASHIPLDMALEHLKVSDKQIVEISKALLNECRLLIMDEPTAALNSTEAEALFEIITTLKRQGVAILYVSHRLAEIFRLADEITVLRDGRHISTRTATLSNPDMLITDMIGRKLQGVFPERNPAIGEEILSASGLTAGNVFEEVSLSLHAGEVLAITGLVGSGITELGKALFGDYPVKAGEIRWFGSVIKPGPANAVAARIGYLPEDRKLEGILGELSVRRNISLPILERLIDRLGFIKRKDETLVAEKQAVDLMIKTPSLEQLVRNLSGGNQQKVALAKWLASDTRLLILMEPTQGIDVAVKFEIYELIAHLSRQGVGVLLISTEIPEILGLAHRILVMHNGKINTELASDQTDSEEILRYALGQKENE